MALSLRGLGARLRPRVGMKFLLAVGVLVPAVLTVAAVGAVGLQRMADRTSVLYGHSLAVSQHTADVVAATAEIHETTFYQVAIHDSRLNGQLDDELEQVLLPRARRAVAVLSGDYTNDPGHRRTVEQIAAGLERYDAFRRTRGYTDTAGRPSTEAARTALAERIDGLLGPIVDTAERLRADEIRAGAVVKRQSDDTYRSTRVLLGVSALIVLLLGALIVAALIRNMVPRIRRYSEFAAGIAAGRPGAPLHPRGADELTELGTALNDMVTARDVATAAEHAQRDLVSRAEAGEAEFVDLLQVTRSEEEAQELLQRHLLRSLPRSEIVVLRRNNSANRLQAATPLAASSPLTARLQGAEPQSCVAVRLGRTHHEGSGRQPLITCALCPDPDRPTTCEPLLVGGEIIGSVLVSHPGPARDVDDLSIKTSVGRAAPVLANLRSLALAEFRANNDSLTGLPNKRATEDTLKRMVAQAGRSVAPLTAIMLDLDHFKEINDRFGHSHGDEVLAAVGAAIAATLRASDFAGRFGGEEFLILLPDTAEAGAWQVAEKIRTGIAAISIPGVERDITASLGVAGLLEHAGNATGLLREADRAQYAAKAAGRNRTVIATPAATADGPVGADAAAAVPAP